MKFTVLTIYPEAFPGTLGISLAGKNLNQNWHLNVINIRDYGIGKHQQVDDEVYGGGSGMLMRADVLGNAIDGALVNSKNPLILATSPRGFLYNQKIANNMLQHDGDIIIICGRFEGIDYRIVEYYKILEISIGNFVLFGGEVVAMCIMESIVRLKNGICGNPHSTEEESFAVGTDFENLMEYPQYTRPAVWKNMQVPSVLSSGHHKNIKEWRLNKSQDITKFYQENQSKIDNHKF